MGHSAERFQGLGRKRRDGVASRSVARAGWLLISLLLDGAVEYAAYIDNFGVGKREFQRDLEALREIGKLQGYTISRTKGGRVFLESTGRRIAGLSAKSRSAAATLARIAAALGGPIERELSEAAGNAGCRPEGRSRSEEAFRFSTCGNRSRP
jgi:predicted DNA-binding transcriptional regulator YafY